MRIFKRRRTTAAPADAIGAFWTWWRQTGATQIAAAIAERDLTAAGAVLSERVHKIHENLDWELSLGLHAKHVLIVTAAGDPGTRAIARRWLRAAPVSDQLWEYADMRRPSPDGGIKFDGMPLVAIETALVTIEPDRREAALHVEVHHPTFPALPEELRQRVTFRLLDLVLGEELVETWIGAISTAVEPPANAVPISELLPAVASFAAAHVAEDGGPSWRLMEGETPAGDRLVATAMVPLRSIQMPHLDTHVAVEVPYKAAREDGLPQDETLSHLRDFEDHLSDRLGDSGRLLAHETAAGSRILHYYVDGTTPAAAQLQAAITGWPDGPVTLAVSTDAGWEDVRHLT
ncbi:DUF695 domain-containing protein [Kribbella qitaiheensis]|uniref:DUF695 domain-containing protein n=1 Tax=Kribbella qitaiheensis TaxID=1544730 RepID=A0A7G6WZ48_9ACTN|nr:DUF695 domain-containing protein [Kribbella qitaiheensis]QNE19263.1 DUF695 domain-containing protein [Kribbella qitaiheensis]